ncbi:DNA excision repair protein ERCC-8-like [Schistocerca gregaria]|uniref:DNA excision repair protein ERCC-8-like n=1 Tax=Schistocerca gregaria TaxID=7010 RepID=UPI00211EA5CC|nr:DNA excision repair protein ERCC-8-like [Schistocerca gregaria]
MVHKFQFEPPVNALSMSPIKSHRPFVAVGTQESDIYLCDLRLGCKGRVLSAHSASITALAWDLGDENLLVSGCSDGTMCMWDIRFPKFFVSFDQSVHLGDKIELEAYNERREQGMPAAHCGAVSSVCFVPGRRQILSSGADQAMHLWDVDYGTNLLVHYPNIQNKGTVKISTSSDGVLVYHPCRRQICVFDIKTGKKVRTLSGHYENVKVSVFHPHLQELYSGSADGEILIWVPSGDQKGRLDPSAVAADARKYRTGSDERRDPGADAEIQECDWYEDEGL